MTVSGWIIAHRTLFDPDHHMAGEPVCRRFAWLDLIQLATHEPFQKPMKNDLIPLARGDVLVSLRYLAKRWGWSKDKVARFITLMRNRSQLAIVEKNGSQIATPHGTVYHVVNYDTYQKPWDSKRDTKRDNGETPARHQRDKDNTLNTQNTLNEEDRSRENGEKMNAQELVGFWIDQLTTRPPGELIGKQGAAAARMCGKYDRASIVQAAVGIGQLYPYSKGEPWDIFDLEAKFQKALEAANNHPAAKNRKTVAALDAIDLGTYSQ